MEVPARLRFWATAVLALSLLFPCTSAFAGVVEPENSAEAGEQAPRAGSMLPPKDAPRPAESPVATASQEISGGGGNKAGSAADQEPAPDKPGKPKGHRPVGFVTLRAEHDQESDAKYTLKTGSGRVLSRGRARNVRSESLRASAILFGHRHFLVMGGFRHDAVHRDASATYTSPRSDFPDGFGLDAQEVSRSYTASLSVIAFGKLMGRTLSFHGMAHADWSPWGYVRTSGMVTAAWNLVESETLKLGVAAIGFINTGASWPVYPFFTLRWKWTRNLSLDILPPMAHATWTSDDGATKWELGLGMESSREYLRAREDDGGWCVSRFSRFQLRPELAFTHQFHPRFSLSLRTGVVIDAASRIYDKSGTSRRAHVAIPPHGFFHGGLVLKI